MLFQVTFSSVNGPRQKELALPKFQVFPVEVSTRVTHMASLQPLVPLFLKARLCLLATLMKNLLDSVPSVPGVGKL